MRKPTTKVYRDSFDLWTSLLSDGEQNATYLAIMNARKEIVSCCVMGWLCEAYRMTFPDDSHWMPATNHPITTAALFVKNNASDYASTCAAPTEVVRWAFPDDNDCFVFSNKAPLVERGLTVKSLTEINDDGVSFPEIIKHLNKLEKVERCQDRHSR